MESHAHGHFEPVHLPRGVQLTSDQFRQLCQLNRDWRFERNATGDIIIMPPTGGFTGARSLNIAVQLGHWAEVDGTGVAFDSSTGFDLPNGATRSPDAAWIRRDRLTGLRADDKDGFIPLCPDFVVELRSPSDRLSDLEQKMTEYADNGAKLGWLIDPAERCVTVYLDGVSAIRLENPATISGDPVLPGFQLELRSIFDRQF